ncbi:TonB-dependent siderophore receptor [Gluconacetobacter tumulisoli]|uniref:TonB-dependent siderophore receptor n=1 Tax=Gluconacetobacter tumulisoli TaxID=1286189 RepID=A0A7W4K5D9_9PROT|nr:TonB-dependent siderophore receptor [Gluconacetobacter tumulisoli]MBB2200583.1 TonB-dependent siderophore receptor [Gluconacetobacter tumulisoli]
MTEDTRQATIRRVNGATSAFVAGLIASASAHAENLPTRKIPAPHAGQSARPAPHPATSQPPSARSAVPAANVVPAPETISVRASARTPRLAAAVPLGALGARSELDTPFAISSVSAAKMEQLQAADINDVFRSEPGVQENSNGGSTASGASFRVRGLSLDWSNGYKIDGMAIPYWYIDLPMANFERLQLTKGASAFMYGFGSPGGVLDFQLKKPVEERKLTLEAGYRTDAVFRQMLDTGGSFDRAHRFTYRLVFGNEVGNQYNSSFMRNTSVSFSTRAQITDNFSWHFDAFYDASLQKDMVNGVAVSSSAIGPNFNYLAPISGRAPFGAPGSWKTNDVKVFRTGFDWNFAPGWRAGIAYGYTHLDERFPSNQVTFTSTNGDYFSRAFEQDRVLGYHQVDASTEGHFQTGPLKHDVLIGITWERQDFAADATAGLLGPTEYGNIHSDRPSITDATNFTPHLYHYLDNVQVAPFWTDTISWRKWSLLAGARYTDYQENDFSTSGAQTAARRNNPVTPIVSLSYKVDPGINAYFSYVEAMQTGGIGGPTNVNYMQVFGPIRSQEYELGLKVQRRIWSGTVALYRLDTGSAYTNAQNYYTQDGISRYQGVEAAGGVRVTRDLTLNGSITYLNAYYVSGPASVVDHKLEAVAPFQASFGADYAIPLVHGLSVNGGFNYVGPSWLDAANTFHLQSYLVGDLGASYVTQVDRHKLTFRATVKNIGNERYWVSRGSYNLFPGAPRTVVLSMRFDL